MVPLMMTDVPTGPDVGEKPVIPGVTVNVALLLETPETVTITAAGPSPRLEGMPTPMLLLLQLVGVTLSPPMVTLLEPCVAPKSLPLMVTAVPTGPEEGDRLLMPGVKV